MGIRVLLISLGIFFSPVSNAQKIYEIDSMSIDNKSREWYENNPFKKADDTAYIKLYTENSIKYVYIYLGAAFESREYSVIDYPGYKDFDEQTRKIAPNFLIINAVGAKKGALSAYKDLSDNQIFEFRFESKRITLFCNKT